MKQIISLILMLGLCTSAALAEGTPVSPAMAVTSAGIINGVLADAYGKKGKDFLKGIPSRSMPLTLANLPKSTAALAIEMVDPDGGDWVHWLAVNLPVETEIPENASIDWADKMVQGKNSFGKQGYGGPTPPHGTHTYVITVYALSDPVELKEGFSSQKFHKAIDGVTLASATVTGDYSKD